MDQVAPHFPLVGWTRNEDAPPLEMAQVFGERRSGTNLVHRLLGRNTGLQMTNRFGWKHGLPAYPVMPLKCLFIGVVRHPLDWLKSFYRGPFEVAPDIARKPFPDFLRAEWESVYTPRNSGWFDHGYELDPRLGRGTVLQLDRHPITGRRFRNVVELRNTKLQGHLSLLARNLNAVFVRYEDVVADQQGFVDTLSGLFPMPDAPAFAEVNRQVGPRAPALDIDFTDEDREFVLSQLDRRQEASVGYDLATEAGCGAEGGAGLIQIKADAFRK
ncbi:hypothetical protein [Pseudooceanicola atlanticus]|uniref:hypothetical protein n=1 Tax=Pseudooceanicola atlanticus TaxID=1461694 RepID=UPI000693D6B5|nr:hypothetical protein [Pseudooceanicola atlanticus]